MKRLHVHVSVKDLSASIRFYRTWFDAEPIVTQPDYAKWMLEDPRSEHPGRQVERTGRGASGRLLRSC